MKSETHSAFGRGAWNWRLTWSSGHGAALSLIVVRTGLPRITPCKPHASHQPLHGAAGNVKALALQLPPDLAHAIDVEVLREDAGDLRCQRQILLRSRWRGFFGMRLRLAVMGMVGRGDLADRLDPMDLSVIVQ